VIRVGQKRRRQRSGRTSPANSVTAEAAAVGPRPRGEAATGLLPPSHRWHPCSALDDRTWTSRSRPGGPRPASIVRRRKARPIVAFAR
jgi:hypothetical protein